MKSLELFNVVLAQESNKDIVVNNDGYVFMPNTLYAKKEIETYFNSQNLTPKQLNAGFYKSFASSGDTLKRLMDQVLHYISTYGNMFEGEMYIPEEIHNIPDQKLKVRVIKSCTSEELKNKCMNMLDSGLALKEETINSILDLLQELNVTFNDGFSIKNKEATIRIMDRYGIVPSNVMDLFRYVFYKKTGSTLLIVNQSSIELMKKSYYDPTELFERFGLDKVSSIFNRYKPLFLAMKSSCPTLINKLSKLSKKYHKPIPVNALNCVTKNKLTENDIHWLNNATMFSLFKAINAVATRINGQKSFSYRVRNGKMYVKNDTTPNTDVCLNNYSFLTEYMRLRFNLTGKRIYIPSNVDYSLPTSEKMFVGNIPVGTKIYGKRLVVGIYWENSWGARDIDLSSVDINNSKVGWNSSWTRNGLTYSGDITNAVNGAVEYIHCDNDRGDQFSLVTANIFFGAENTKFKLIVGDGEDISKQYLMDPNNVIIDEYVVSPQKQTTLGILGPNYFVVVNGGSGNARVSSKANGLTALVENSLFQVSLKTILSDAGAEIVSDVTEADIDLSVNKVSKDTFVNLFKEQ